MNPNGNPLAPFGPFQTPPTLQVRPVPAVVGTVPDFTVMLTVIVVAPTAVTRPTKFVTVAASRYTEAKSPTLTVRDGLPLVGVKTPVPEFQPPFVAVYAAVPLVVDPALRFDPFVKSQ
jgi:hypothetical protein